MPDEPNTPANASAPPEAAHIATPQSDPTPAQVESRSVVAGLTKDIDDLWSQLEGRGPATPEPPAESTPEPAETPLPTAQRVRDEQGRFTKAEAPQPAATPETTPPPAGEPVATAETPPPAAVDREAIEREVRERFETEQQARADAERRVREEAEHRRTYESYLGSDEAYASVNAALRASQRGDFTALDALDVVLPNGKKVSEVKPDKTAGLTAEEAASLLDTWDTNRRYEGVMGDRKVAQVLSYWDQQVVAALRSPDVDAERVRSFRTPGEQMQAAIDTTRAAVEARKDAEITALKQQLAEKDERITSLVNERGNLTSQQRAAMTASPDRPGAPGTRAPDLPSVEELRQMSAEEAFKSGAIDRLLQQIPGGVTPIRPTRRAV